jgi:hypothetical protein
MDTLFQSQNPDEQAQFKDQIQKNVERYYEYNLKKNPFPLGGNYPETYLPYTYFDPQGLL